MRKMKQNRKAVVVWGWKQPPADDWLVSAQSNSRQRANQVGQQNSGRLAAANPSTPNHHKALIPNKDPVAFKGCSFSPPTKSHYDAMRRTIGTWGGNRVGSWLASS